MDESDQTPPDVFSLSRRSLLQSVPLGAVLGVAPTQSTASPTTQQLVVRTSLPSPDVGTGLPFEAKRKQTAAATQQPLLTLASNRAGIDVRKSFWLFDGVLVEIDPAEISKRTLEQVDTVSRVHENREFRLPSPQAVSPTEHGSGTYGLDQIGIPAVWEQYGTRGEGASVAVIDTGVDPAHPDIDINENNFAAFDADGNQRPDPEVRDTSYHGTHVSGTVVGGDNSGQHIGVAPEATLYHGVGLPDGTGTFAQIIAALEWAVENGVDVANLSLGAPGFIAEMIEPVRNAVEAGTVVVAAAGNDGEDVVATPGSVFEAVAVGGTDENREVPAFSGGRVVDTSAAWGRDAPDGWPEEYVVPDVSAPGVAVLSAFPEDADPPPGTEPIDDLWLELSGTSMAAPHVAGTLALMRGAAQSVPDSYDPSQAVRALSTTATKPADRPEQDPRYGEGVVDAVAATSRFAAPSGVEGTVTGQAGAPVSGGTVSLDGFPVETGDDGSYRIRATAGSYSLSANGFGFEPRDRAVEVGDGFTTEAFQLSRTLDVELATGQPAGIEASDQFSVGFGIANVEGYTFELTGEVQEAVRVSTDGEEIQPGEEIPVEDGATKLTVTVDPSDDARGDLTIEHSFNGLDETVEQTTGPTAVFEEFVEVAVVDRENGEFTEDLVGLLDERLAPIYELSVMTPPEALVAAQEGSVAAFVVQSLGEDQALIESFVAETAIPQLGVVYLQQVGGTEELAAEGRAADGIHKLSRATGDPDDVIDNAVEGANPRVRYKLTDESHQIIQDAGVSSPVTLYEAFPVQFFGAFHSYFERFEGTVGGRTIATVSAGIRTGENPGLAVDDLSRTVLAASLGLSAFVGRRVFQSEAVDLLASATEYAATSPRVSVVENQPDRIDPGETVELQVTTRDLLEYELTLGAQSTLAEADLAASVNGERISFGEPITTDEFTGELRIQIAVPDSAGHRVSLSHRFVTVGRQEEQQTTTAETGPTAIYAPPLSVPGDMDSLTQATRIVQKGGEIALGDQVFATQEPDSPATGLSVETPGLTLRAKEGAQPSIIHEADEPNPTVVAVSGDGVTVDGIDLNVVDGSLDEKNSTASALAVRSSTSDVTVRNLRVGGTFGVQIEGDTAGIAVENVTAIRTVVGVGTSSSGSGTVEDATITNVTITQRPESTFRGGVLVSTAASGITVTDCEIELGGGEVGIELVGPFGGGEQCTITGNTVVPAGSDGGMPADSTGVFLDEIATVVENNSIDGVETGVQVSELGFGNEAIVIRDNELNVAAAGVAQFGDYVTVTANRIEAETGLKLGEDPEGSFPVLVSADAVVARDNDLSGTALPVAGQPDDGFDSPDGPFDCRQNYLGERGYDDQIAAGNVAYDPFLTEPIRSDTGQPTRVLATDCLLDPATPYGLGIPGPTDQSIWEILGAEGPDAFLGQVATWDQSAGAFTPVTDESTVDALDAFRVVAGSGVRAVIQFQYRGDDPRDGIGGEPRARDVESGTNLVCAPAYGDDSVFETGTAEVEQATRRWLQPPRQQVGPDDGPDPSGGADNSALSAHFVEVTSPGTIEPGLDEYNPTLEEFLSAVGLDTTIHENPGSPPPEATDDPLPLATLDRGQTEADQPSVRAVAAVLASHLRRARTEREPPVTALEQSIQTLQNSVDRESVLERAASRLLRQWYGIQVIDTGGQETD